MLTIARQKYLEVLIRTSLLYRKFFPLSPLREEVCYASPDEPSLQQAQLTYSKIRSVGSLLWSCPALNFATFKFTT